ncbi:MAG TPA: hypothetical protein VN181_10490, partial [Thermoanaerobaculia bacterium]|nr:hypothetical protein [Thermoanaerobaculia bacterium]
MPQTDEPTENISSTSSAAATGELPASPVSDDSASPPFEFTEERKFELYIQQRKGYSEGARDAYQRFDQTIVALSGGSIVLSLTFLKDIGHTPESLPWLFCAWASFLTASLSAFISLLTSGEADRERISQLDCQVEKGTCDESRAERLGRATTRLNYVALSLCLLGVILMIVFATYNLPLGGGQQWPKAEKTTPESPPAVTNTPIQRPAKKVLTAAPSAATASQAATLQKHTPVSPSQHR